MKDWIKKHPRQSAIGAVVLVGHLFFTFYEFKKNHPIPTPKQSIIVHTHTEKPKPKPRPEPQSQIVSNPKPKPSSTKKKIPPPKPTKKKIDQNILKELEQTLAKIEQKQKAPESIIPLTVPKAIEELHIDQMPESLPIGETSYLSLLVQSLRETLELPEDGRVRVQVTVLKSGRVEKVQVLYAESENNKCYLERELIHMTLPPFSDELAGKMQHTFTLNFCHEK